ncbi:hypothetical protein JMY91_05025 [Brenneria goodwinii]|nr:hypothetical protein [Brenneria goodwinii]
MALILLVAFLSVVRQTGESRAMKSIGLNSDLGERFGAWRRWMFVNSHASKTVPTELETPA